MTTLPAPPDLAALIDAVIATERSPTSQDHIDALYALRRWGMEKRHRYVHAGRAVSLVWGSLQVVRWPAEGPRPKHVLDHLDRSMSRDQVS